jgi:hypothetical protein
MEGSYLGWLGSALPLAALDVGLGENLATTLQTLVRDAKNLHPLTVSRVVSYLLKYIHGSVAGGLGGKKQHATRLVDGGSSHRAPVFDGRADPNQPKYDPSMVFVLELATVLTLRDEKTLEEV